jgi:glucose-1-phosphate adenylyltransferase
MELLLPNPPLVLSDPDWPVFTYQQQTPPAEFVSRGMGSQIENALISGGCIVESSSLSNTILFPNSRVEHGCEIDNALILPESRIGRGCRLKNVIIDNGCTVPAGTVIGENPEQDGLRYKVTDGGTVVVARFMLGVESDKLLPPRFRP